LLTFVFAVSAQDTDKNRRSEKDPRNTVPTVGTGGAVGGPTGLFTVYDGQTLRRGEYTFSLAYSNFDRDPGNLDIVEVPVSFQFGLTNHVELFFNTDAYRAIKANSPANLSGFYLPNSRLQFGTGFVSPPAIILAPQGPGVNLYPGAAIFRPTGSAPFVAFPYVGGSAGNFGLAASGPVFGFASGNALIGAPVASGNGAARFPGLGSVYGSILPGIVFQTTRFIPVTGGPGTEIPTSFTTMPSYNPEAPFLNRGYGESSFSTMSFGAKWRWTGLNNPVGLGMVAYYKWYMDHASDFGGFNQLQRGASPGGNRGDIGVSLFADARVRKWMNISANAGYLLTSKVEGDFPSGKFTILDRPDEFTVAAGVDFPVNKHFQPIMEFRALRYMGGRTPNAFENNPMDGIAGARFFPTRWMSIGAAYRIHFNQEDRDYFNDDSFGERVAIVCGAATVCTPTVITSTPKGAPAGFQFSTDPHGFIFQVTAGRRHKRQAEIQNQAANVTALTLSDSEVMLPCPPGFSSASGGCNDSSSISVSTTAVDPENDVLTYNYTVSGGRIVGSGANVQWDVSGLPKGTYTITSGVDDGCGICGQTQTKTITIADCPDCRRGCDCPSLSVSGPAGITAPGGTMTFTANLGGGSQDQVTYNWSVSAGTIESGQGTPSITVSVPSDMAGGNITATVDVGGFDPNCNCTHTASETAGVTPPSQANLIDEFGKATDDDVKARVDNWYIQLNQNPSAQGYVINYGTPAEIKRRKAQIQKAINFRKYDASRLTFVDGPDNGTGPDTKFYLVPPGADNPQP
jgi:hypothetical protein